MFHRKYPEVLISRHQLRSVYKQSGIKKKVIRQRKRMKVKDKKREKEQILECQEKVQTLMKQGYDIVFLDETMVTRSTLPKLEWSLPGANMSYDTRDFHI